jgi:hypothetical protein
LENKKERFIKMKKHEYEACAINTLRAIGADYQQKHGSMTFARNGIVVIADYHEVAERCVGTVLTYHAYALLCDAYESSKTTDSLAVFAWGHGWGYDIFSAQNIDVVQALQYINSLDSAPYLGLNKIGYESGHVIYFVKERLVNCRVLIGAYNELDNAFEATKSKCTNSTVEITPLIVDVTYPRDQRPYMGS